MPSPWAGLAGSDTSWTPLAVDTSVAHPARRYDYWLGGKDNFEADRRSGDAVAAVFPTVRESARENRRFLGRVVRHLAGAGIDQFLDVGTGIPATDNTHEVAQGVLPAARVVYVDNDPIVLAHARALLTCANAEGTTAYVDADLRDPRSLLDAPALAETLDLSRPVALLLVAVLHFIPDTDRPYDLVRQLVDALPPGSYLAMSHGTLDHLPPPSPLGGDVHSVSVEQGFRARSREEFARFFDGTDLLEPGIVAVSDWRAGGEPEPRPSPADVSAYGAVARLRPAG